MKVYPQTFLFTDKLTHRHHVDARSERYDAASKPLATLNRSPILAVSDCAMDSTPITILLYSNQTLHQLGDFSKIYSTNCLSLDNIKT